MKRKIIALLLSLGLLFQQTGFTQVAATELNLSGYLAKMSASFIQDKFRPLHLRYFSYDSLNNNFKLLLDKGDFEKGLSPQGTVPEEKLKQATKTLLNYFLIGVTLPNESFWVNLRPDSESQVIDDSLAQTDIGKIMLEADLELKKDTARYTSPQTPEGREYWDKLYKKAGELFGSDNITIPTLTRPWILPNEIIVRETTDSAYIYKATLKVMLEEDYLSKGLSPQGTVPEANLYSFKDTRLKALNKYSSQLIRELIIPKLTQEVNISKRYAPLRQVYYSLILSRWFKSRFLGKSGVYASLIDKSDLNGLTSKESWSKATYFKAYQKSFAQGEYNLKEPVYTPYGQVIRSYFSGGVAWGEFKIPGVSSPVANAGATQVGIFHGAEKLNFTELVVVTRGSLALAGNALPGTRLTPLSVTNAFATAEPPVSSREAKSGPGASSPVTYSDARISFAGRSFAEVDPAIFNAKPVQLAAQYALNGEVPVFPEPTGQYNSRFGYKDPNGALRMDNRQKIMDWVEQRKKQGAKAMIHFGIGGQGMSNSVQADYWGQGKNSEVIVVDRLGTSMRKLFEDSLRYKGYKISEIVLDVSSKSGSTDEPLSLYQEALNEFLRLMALEKGMDRESAIMLVDKFIKLFQDFNRGKQKDALFKGITLVDFQSRFNERERSVIGAVLERIVFTTSQNAAASRLYAFALGMKELQVADIAVFDFSEYTGGRFTENSESGATTQAFQGLPIVLNTAALQEQARHYWGAEGNDPDKNSALRAAILTRRLNPSIMVVAVRSSNAASEALQKEQLFPESNGKDGQGIWVVVSVGERELERKLKQIKAQTGKQPLVIVVDQKGFDPMPVPEDVPVIRYLKDEISSLANAKFALWFQEYTVRYGLLSLAEMAVEKGIDLDIPRVGASLMNKPVLDGAPNFWWLRDPQNQPMVELAKGILLKVLNALSESDKADEATRLRYQAVEARISSERFIDDDEINLASPHGESNLPPEQRQSLLASAGAKIRASSGKVAQGASVSEEALFSTLARIKWLKTENKRLAAELLRYSLANDVDGTLRTQRSIEKNDASIMQAYDSIGNFGKEESNISAIESAAHKLAQLMLVARERGKIFSPVFYTADPDADILGELLQLVDYGIGTRDQHANFQHRHDGRDITVTLLVDFVMPYAQVAGLQNRIRTYGLANDYLDGMYPDEVRREFLRAEFRSLSGAVTTDAIDHNGQSYQKSFHRDVAILTLPDISTRQGMITAIQIFNRAKALFEAATSSSPAQSRDIGIRSASSPVVVVSADMGFETAYNAIIEELPRETTNSFDSLERPTLQYIKVKRNDAGISAFVEKLLGAALKLHNELEVRGNNQDHRVYEFVHGLTTAIVGIKGTPEDISVEYWTEEHRTVCGNWSDERVRTYLVGDIVKKASASSPLGGNESVKPAWRSEEVVKSVQAMVALELWGVDGSSSGLKRLRNGKVTTKELSLLRSDSKLKAVIDEIEDEYGVKLDPEKVLANTGKRTSVIGTLVKMVLTRLQRNGQIVNKADGTVGGGQTKRIASSPVEEVLDSGTGGVRVPRQLEYTVPRDMSPQEALQLMAAQEPGAFERTDDQRLVPALGRALFFERAGKSATSDLPDKLLAGDKLISLFNLQGGASSPVGERYRFTIPDTIPRPGGMTLTEIIREAELIPSRFLIEAQKGYPYLSSSYRVFMLRQGVGEEERVYYWFTQLHPGDVVIIREAETEDDNRTKANSPMSAPENPGGIDFRALPMALQPMGSFSGLNFNLPLLSSQELESINLDEEMREIQNMIKAGIIPSGQRLKEFVAACSQKGAIRNRVDDLILCLVDIFKLEEERASESTPELKETLVVVDSKLAL